MSIKTTKKETKPKKPTKKETENALLNGMPSLIEEILLSTKKGNIEDVNQLFLKITNLNGNIAVLERKKNKIE
jgi:hypothetical protein